MPSSAHWSVLLLLTATLAGCGDDGETGPVTPVALTAHTSTTLEGTVGTAVGSAPSVRVVGSDGQPYGGATVSFQASGGGTVADASVTSDAQGVASTGGWTLGTAAGPQTLTASSSGLSGVTFTATAAAGPPSDVAMVAGDGQEGPVGAPVPTAPSVEVSDAHGNAVQGVTVTFEAASGGGQVLGGAATTDAQGVATVGGWILGTAPGANTLTASAGAAASVTFTATGSAVAAARLVTASGNGQSGDLGTPLDDPLEVRVTDAFGNVVAGVEVEFAVTSGNAQLSATSATSNAEGVASTTLTLTGAGASTVTATAPSLPGASLVFNADTGPTIVGQVTIPEGLAMPFLGVQPPEPPVAASGPEAVAAGPMSKGTDPRVAEALAAQTPEEAARRLVTRGRIVVTFDTPAFDLPATAQAYGDAELRQNAVAAYRAALQPLEQEGLFQQRAISPAIGAALVQAAPDRDPEDVMEVLRADPRIRTVEEDGVMWAAHAGHIMADPADLRARRPPPPPLPFTAPPTEQYATDPFSYYQTWHYTMLGLNHAWPLTTGSTDVRVAILDTGIHPSQPDVAGLLSSGADHFDFTDGVTQAFSDPQPICGGGTFQHVRGSAAELAQPRDEAQDPLQVLLVGPSPTCWTRRSSGSHGTHVAGTIGAAHDGYGGSGVSWTSNLMAVRVLGVTGSGFTFDVAQGILFAGGLPATYTGAPMGFTVQTTPAHVINMSLGGGASSTVIDNAVAATSQNSLIIAAAGNHASTAAGQHPASNPLVFTVAALDPFGGIASYSNTGSPVDGAAPGGDFRYGPTAGVLSSTFNYQTGEPNHAWYQGTSMATPHVTGVAALVQAMNPGFSPAEVRSRLEEGAIDVGPPGRDDETGFGIVNAYNALTGKTGPDAVTKVHAIDPASGAVVRSRDVGPDGRFTMANLPVGDYFLVAGQDADGDAAFGYPGRRLNWYGGDRMAPITLSGPAVENLGFVLSAPTESEPNDELAEAQPLVVDSWITGNLSGPDTRDLYSVMIPESGSYTFETSGLGTCGVATDLDTVLTLLDSGGTTLASNDDTAFPTPTTPSGTASYPGLMCSQIQMTLQPGLHHLQVTAFGASRGTYRLHVRSGS